MKWEKWRVIKLSTNSASENMAIDESILDSLSRGEVPNTLRLYRWKPSAVSIGYFQGINEEVNLNECRKRGFDVVRRITGGGAVFHSYEGEITYSLLMKDSLPHIPNNILQSYEVILTGLIKGLEKLGIQAQFRPVNDIVVNGRKISGSAQTRRKGVILQHGTLITKLDPHTMFSVLKVSQAKLSDKLVKSVYKSVTSMEEQMGKTPDFTMIAQALISGFSTQLKFQPEYDDLTDIEKNQMKQLKAEKFERQEWNYKR